MEPGSFVDEDSIRKAMGDTSFAALESKLRDKWSAQVFFSQQKRERMAAASQRIGFAANHRMGGMRPTLNIDFTLWAYLNMRYPGWAQDKEFERDLLRHHPECRVKLEKREDFSGWSRGRETKPTAKPTCKPAAPAVARSQTLVLTDKRGNAA